MKLYVMRHSVAEDVSRDGSDGARALTAIGRDRARDVAKVLLELDEAPRAIVSSPLVRALQTAEIVHAHAGLDVPLEIAQEMSPGGDALAMVLTAARMNRKRLMVVGHEPDVSTLVARLIGAPPRAGFGKAMVVGIRVTPEGDHATLRFVLDPKTCSLSLDRRQDLR
ncbi:MAG: phosphohistidine phosphatase SixA [Polyangiales bacterium]